MPRIEPVDLNRAEGQAKGLLENVQKALGAAPNLIRTLAHSPAALEAYLSFGKALGGGKLSAALREQIALTVAGANSCDYCAAAHTELGKRFGLRADELAANLTASSGQPTVQAALQFARSLVEKRGWVGDEEVQAVRSAGYGDGEIAEIVAAVSINIFSNYFHHVSQAQIDFPVVEVGEPKSCCATADGPVGPSCAGQKC